MANPTAPLEKMLRGEPALVVFGDGVGEGLSVPSVLVLSPGRTIVREIVVGAVTVNRETVVGGVGEVIGVLSVVDGVGVTGGGVTGLGVEIGGEGVVGGGVVVEGIVTGGSPNPEQVEANAVKIVSLGEVLWEMI